VRPPNTALRKPTRTNCAIDRAAAKLRRFGSGLGFVGSPVGHTTGDFLLALGLVARAALERRFKLQPQLPGLSPERRPRALASQRKALLRVGVNHRPRL